MTMDQLYLPITLVLLTAVLVRIPSIFRSRDGLPSWLATVFAVPALLTRGAVIPIEELDRWLGGQNIIFLVQCWFATFAFWAIGEAARARIGAESQLARHVWVPFAWSAVYTVPFFLISQRTPTELFFIDAHVTDPAAVTCGILYIGGITALCLDILKNLRGRRSMPHALLKLGAAAVAGGSILWGLAIAIHHMMKLERSQILWMYLGFDVLFYPGVVLLALGLVSFAVQRRLRAHGARTRLRYVTTLATANGLELELLAADEPHQLFDAMVQMRDSAMLGVIAFTAAEEVKLHQIAEWLRKALPRVGEIDERKVVTHS